jgi:hypothetical protein
MRLRVPLLFLIIISVCQVRAQSIGIGTTTPDASAVLDVSGNRGLLLPRLTTIERDAILNPAKGLVIFCSTDNSFYCFDGSWKKLALPEHVWNLQGNSGTNPATHFIGTTDATPLVFGVGGNPRMRLLADGRLNLEGFSTLIGRNAGANLPDQVFFEAHFVGYEAGMSNNAGEKNFFTGYKAGRSNTVGSRNYFSGHSAGFSNISGEANHFVGYRAGENNTIGSNNHFSGYLAGNNNSTGSFNTFIGNSAGFGNNTASNNVSIGYRAGSSTNADGNTFIGTNCGAGNFTGFNNVFVGISTGSGNSTGHGNVFIGHDAGDENWTGSNNTLIGEGANVSAIDLNNAGAIGYNAIVSQSNSFVIGGTGANAVRVGIGITAPATTLHVNGTVAGIGPYINLSDSRLKTNISPIIDALSGIVQLQPVSYDWKKEAYPQFNFDNKRQIGFLAQELEKIFPEAVTLGADGFYTIAYSQLIPVVVQGIKEQQQQIDSLRSENIQLKSVLELLSKEIEAIKKQMPSPQK